MPSILKVRIVSGRDLPIMDRATELTDAFVEVKFADFEPQRTAIARRTLNPIWNQDFRFEVSDDADLQNEPLEIKVMDYDTITYNDAIGTVFIDINSLLAWDSSSVLSGYFPIFDTLRGVRGELSVQVRIQFFGDTNPLKDSSAGVQFFSIKSIPNVYNCNGVIGFVSALDKADDPEYHWSDNFRTPRTSNEARTRIMFQLSGQLRRQIGKRVIEMNGNAVIGYKQYFDLDSEERVIVARAIGTAVKLGLPETISYSKLSPINILSSPGGISVVNMYADTSLPTSPVRPLPPLSLLSAGDDNNLEKSPIRSLSFDRESSILQRIGAIVVDQHILTLDSFPPGCIQGIGGFVSAASVKIIENDDKEVRGSWWTELRDELKSHAKVVACNSIIGYTEQITIDEDLAVLQCTGTAAIIDFRIFKSEDLIQRKTSLIFTETEAVTGGTGHSEIIKLEHLFQEEAGEEELGTPAILKSFREPDSLPHIEPDKTFTPPVASMLEAKLANLVLDKDPFSTLNRNNDVHTKKKLDKSTKISNCRSCHTTYKRLNSPFPMAFVRCGICKKKYVPEILLTSIQPLPELEVVGAGALLEAHVCRPKKAKNATIISESIPFIQYDIHQQLVHKLRISGFNAIFGLKIQMSIGESMMTAVATGTALFLRALPLPPSLKVYRNLDVVDEEDQQLLELQRKITAQSEVNRNRIKQALVEIKAAEDREKALSSRENGTPRNIAPRGMSLESLYAAPLASDSSSSESDSDSDKSVDGFRDIRNSSTKKRSVVVQIDDEQDEDLVLLLDPTFPIGFQLLNIEGGSSEELCSDLPQLQMITMIKQESINPSHHPNRQLAHIFKTLYQELQVQLSYLSPCLVSGITYDVQLLKENDVQITLTAAAVGQLVSFEVSDTDVDEAYLLNLEQMLLNDSTSLQAFMPTVTNVGPQLSSFSAGASGVASAIRKNLRHLARNSWTSRENLESALSAEEDHYPIELLQLEIPVGNAHGEAPAATLEGNRISIPDSTPIPYQHHDSLHSSLRNATSSENLNIGITPLSTLPNCTIERFLGRLSLHFVKENNIIFETGSGLCGMGGFTHSFICELYSVLRAHTAGLGGNGLIGVNIDQIVCSDSNIKNQGYAFISVSGDVVHASCKSDGGSRLEACEGFGSEGWLKFSAKSTTGLHDPDQPMFEAGL